MYVHVHILSLSTVILNKCCINPSANGILVDVACFYKNNYNLNLWQEKKLIYKIALMNFTVIDRREVGVLPYRNAAPGRHLCRHG